MNGPKSHRKEIILLTATLIILFVLGEVFFRFYYWRLDKPVAVDRNELCLKEMKKPESYVSVSPDNFVYQHWWDEHPLIGLVPKPNYSGDDARLFLKTADKAKLVYAYAIQHHNSQGLTNVEDFAVEKPKHISTRIALFGDSFTCGSEGPLLFNMGYLLKELIPKSEVLNFCVLGQGIDTMFARYVIESKQYSPDVVVFNVFVDDIKRPFECQLFHPNLIISNGKLTLAERRWATLKDFYFNYKLPRFESYFIKHVLWVYNEHTKVNRDFAHGLELLNVMLDELQQQTREKNQTLVVIPIIHEESTELEKNMYDRMLDMLKEKNVLSFDSWKFFLSNKKTYRNESFYYIAEKDGYGHFNPIGNAVFAQHIKGLLEQIEVVPKSPNYFFSTFKKFEFMYLIPDTITDQMQGKVRVLSTFNLSEGQNDFGFYLKRDISIVS